MPLKSDYNHIICIMEGETKNIRFVLRIIECVSFLENGGMPYYNLNI